MNVEKLITPLDFFFLNKQFLLFPVSRFWLLSQNRWLVWRYNPSIQNGGMIKGEHGRLYLTAKDEVFKIYVCFLIKKKNRKYERHRCQPYYKISLTMNKYPSYQQFQHFFMLTSKDLVR